MLQLSRHHVTAFLDPGRSQFVEQLRQTWDPGMARQIAAHLTLVYPEEIPDAAELAARAALAAARTPPFAIAVGSPVHAGSPADGVFLRVDDVDGGIRAFRAAAMAAADALGFPPHITIVHPRTSRCGGQAWAELASTRIDACFTITEVTITAFNGDRWPVLQVLPLTGHQPWPREDSCRLCREDAAASRTGSGPVNLATIRAAVIAAIKDSGYLYIPEGRRDHTTPAEALRLHGLD